jgi:hypothetical protein
MLKAQEFFLAEEVLASSRTLQLRNLDGTLSLKKNGTNRISFLPFTRETYSFRDASWPIEIS